MNFRLLCAAFLGVMLAVTAASAARCGEVDAAKLEQELSSGDRARVGKAAGQMFEVFRTGGARELGTLAPAALAAWEKNPDIRELGIVVMVLPAAKDAEYRRKLGAMLEAAAKAGEVRNISVLAVAAAGCGEDGAQFVPTLVWMLGHKDANCRMMGLAALARMGKPAAAQARDAVAKLAGSDKECQLLAQVVLIRMGQGVGREALESAVKNSRQEIHLILGPVVLDEQVKPLLSSGDQRVRRQAWAALAGSIEMAVRRNVTVVRPAQGMNAVIDPDARATYLAQAEWIRTNAKAAIDQKGDAVDAAEAALKMLDELAREAAERQKREAEKEKEKDRPVKTHEREKEKEKEKPQPQPKPVDPGKGEFPEDY